MATIFPLTSWLKLMGTQSPSPRGANEMGRSCKPLSWRSLSSRIRRLRYAPLSGCRSNHSLTSPSWRDSWNVKRRTLLRYSSFFSFRRAYPLCFLSSISRIHSTSDCVYADNRPKLLPEEPHTVLRFLRRLGLCDYTACARALIMFIISGVSVRSLMRRACLPAASRFSTGSGAFGSSAPAGV